MQVILAAVDLGAGAQHVLEGAATLARWADAALHVLHVSETVSPDAARSAAVQKVLAQEREKLHVLVQRCCAGSRIESQQVLTGKPGRTICDRARAVEADVIVLGAHTDGELGARLFGTTAERVVHAANVPCLIMRAPLPPTLTSIAIGTDFSPESVAAAHVAAKWLRCFGEQSPQARLHLVHVGWPMDRLADPELESGTLRPRLREIEQQLVSAGPVPIELHVVWSNPPAATMVEWARRHRCDLLVLGTTGRSGLGDRLLGSVASSIVRRAPCAVLLVPTVEKASGRRN
jgi:nucleotide-binding universal stress UspA family protein